MQIAKYDVPPFSGARYHENEQRASRVGTPCCICGLPVKAPWPHTAVVTGGGDTWGDENTPENDSGFMGCFPVGPDCHRKHVIQG